MTEDFPTPALHLRQEFERRQTHFDCQPVMTQRYIENQARLLADGLVAGASRLSFALPDQVLCSIDARREALIPLPPDQRQQVIGGVTSALRRVEIRQELLHRLTLLEHAENQAVAASAELMRYATATHLVVNMLPTGRTITYRPDDDEAVPSIPTNDDTPESAITQASDAIALDGTAIAEDGNIEAERGELQVPYVPAARQFYLPQWVAFDGPKKLLAGSEKEAEACVQSMQRYVGILHRASALAPYMVASEEYQRKRYGILGQLINQGRALATFKTGVIIQEIKTRSGQHDLNRGLSITMPYFDDQHLAMGEIHFVVIPAGRIMFIPAFVVRAAQGEQAKVSQDTRLNASTRKHLLNQLRMLEAAFA
jgi:hypothetical protein